AVLALFAIAIILGWLLLKSRKDRKPQRSRRSSRRKISQNEIKPPQNPVATVLLPIRVKEKPQPDWHKMPPLKKGDSIGLRFSIYDVLGRGGFGIVFLVFDKELKKL